MTIVISGGTDFIGQAGSDLSIEAGPRVFVTGDEALVPVERWLRGVGNDLVPRSGGDPSREGVVRPASLAHDDARQR